jgi:1-acyl-sn-glycerol-3-phosphate acyltransferase
VALAMALAANILHFWLIRLRGPLTLEQRALWLHASCKRVLTSIGVRCRVEGRISARGLVVSNHLSHLDILIYGAIAPWFFVSKVEVARWPYFGRAARTGGALFLDRASRSSAVAVAREMSLRVKTAVPVLLFPEGTSTDGAEVLRFHSELFEPAVAGAAPVTAAAIRYILDGGIAERELCWYGDMLFLPHLWNVLCTRGFTAEVRFAPPRTYANRRIAAQSTHAEVVALRNIGTAPAAPASNPSLSRAIPD